MRLINNYTASLVRGGTKLPRGAVPLACDMPASVICLLPGNRWMRWWPGTGSPDYLDEDPWPQIVNVYLAKLAGNDLELLARYLEVVPQEVTGWLGGLPLRLDHANRIEEILSDRRKEGQ